MVHESVIHDGQSKEEKSVQNDINPTGVLAVHIKKCHILSIDFTNFSSQVLSLYLRIHAGGETKCSVVQDSVFGPRTLVLDDLKHFLLRVSNKSSDVSNNIRIDLVGFDKPDLHKVIAVKELHVYDVIKKLFMVENIELRHKEKLVAEVELEMCFSYGMFGYGYSNQLENRQMSAQDQIAHSMFLRSEPPSDRCDHNVMKDILTCQPVGHPDFLNLTRKVEIGSTAKEFESTTSLASDESDGEPYMLIARIRRRMLDLQKGFSSQATRADRLQYLRHLVTPETLASSISDEFKIPRRYKLKHRLPDGRTTYVASAWKKAMPKSLRGRGAEVGAVEGDSIQKDTDIKDIANVLKSAPGIVSSGRRGGQIQPTTARQTDLEEEAESDTEQGETDEEKEKKELAMAAIRKLMEEQTEEAEEKDIPADDSPAVTDEEDDAEEETPVQEVSPISASTTRRPSHAFQSTTAVLKKRVQPRRFGIFETAHKLFDIITHRGIDPEKIPRIIVTPSTPTQSELNLALELDDQYLEEMDD